MDPKKSIAEAEAIFKAKTPELRAFQMSLPTQQGQYGPHLLIGEWTMHNWLSNVKHVLAGRHRKMRRYATAYYSKQQIIYNPLYLEKVGDEKDFLDTVLHELGHLFTYHFFKEIGHQKEWQRVGSIVGYAEVGCTSDQRRQRMPSYSAHSGTVPVEAPVGRIEEVPVDRNFSTIGSPVRTVWAICDKFPNATRAQLIATCIKHGVNKNTAATQYAAWKRDRNPAASIFRW